MNIFMNYWILPILFILHDFEEIILIKSWNKRDKNLIATMEKPFFGGFFDTSSFSVGVLEEMIILIIISIICSLTENNFLYLSFIIAYASHFILHYRMCLKVKRYVPGVITAILQLPFMIWLIFNYCTLINTHLLSFAFYLITALLISYVNLAVMHKLLPKIHKLLNNYSNT